MTEQPITDAERAELKRLRAELYHFEMSSQVNDHVLTEVREALRTPPGKSIIEHAGRLLAENERLGAALRLLLSARDCLAADGSAEIPEALSASFDIGLDDARALADVLGAAPEGETK